MYSLVLEFDSKAVYMTVKEWVTGKLSEHRVVAHKVRCRGVAERPEDALWSVLICVCVLGTEFILPGYIESTFTLSHLIYSPQIILLQNVINDVGDYLREDGAAVVFPSPIVPSRWRVTPGKPWVLPQQSTKSSRSRAPSPPAAEYQAFGSKNVREEIYTSSHDFSLHIFEVNLHSSAFNYEEVK